MLRFLIDNILLGAKQHFIFQQKISQNKYTNKEETFSKGGLLWLGYPNFVDSSKGNNEGRRNEMGKKMNGKKCHPNAVDEISSF